MYLSAVTDFYACNLEDNISEIDFRISHFEVDKQQRQSLFLSALDYKVSQSISANSYVEIV